MGLALGLEQDRSVYCRPVSLWVSGEGNSPLTDALVSDTERCVSAPHRHRTPCTEIYTEIGQKY